MSFVTYRKSNVSVLEQTSDSERIACVAVICALASFPLLLSVALTIWGA